MRSSLAIARDHRLAGGGAEGDQLAQEGGDGQRSGAGDVAGDRLLAERGGIDVQAGTGLQRIADGKADDQRQGRDHLEIDECRHPLVQPGALGPRGRALRRDSLMGLISNAGWNLVASSMLP
jgi:hypothetical protein